LKIFGNINLPPGNIILRNFNDNEIPQRVLINKNEVQNFNAEKIIIDQFPAVVEIFY
jgi:hypothetical protein